MLNVCEGNTLQIVLDTNVLISGTFWTGSSYEILKLIHYGKLKLVVSLPILAEYDRVLHSSEILDKQAYQYERVLAIQKVIQTALLVKPTEHVDLIKEDVNDNKFIEAALEGADYIVSRDYHLLKLKQYKNIKIVSPEEFLTL